MDEIRVIFDYDYQMTVGSFTPHHEHITEVFREGFSLVVNPILNMPEKSIVALSLQHIPAWEKARLDEETRKIIEDQAAEIERLKQLLSPTAYPRKLHPETRTLEKKEGDEIVKEFEGKEKLLVPLPKDV